MAQQPEMVTVDQIHTAGSIAGNINCMASIQVGV
jgi:hypothetical protein